MVTYHPSLLIMWLSVGVLFAVWQVQKREKKNSFTIRETCSIIIILHAEGKTFPWGYSSRSGWFSRFQCCVMLTSLVERSPSLVIPWDWPWMLWIPDAIKTGDLIHRQWLRDIVSLYRSNMVPSRRSEHTCHHQAESWLRHAGYSHTQILVCHARH